MKKIKELKWHHWLLMVVLPFGVLIFAAYTYIPKFKEWVTKVCTMLRDKLKDMFKKEKKTLSDAGKDQVTTHYTDNSNAPRGVRNKNPLNIRISESPWQGKVPNSENTDGAFEQFIDVKYGIRAAFKTLKTYFHTHQLNTITGLISRWAPSNENNTQNYINLVAERTGIDKDEELPWLPTGDQLINIVSEMSRIELGKNYQVPTELIVPVVDEFLNDLI